jgi:hypothetical protein
MQNQGRPVFPKSPLSAQEEGKGRCIAERYLDSLQEGPKISPTDIFAEVTRVP